MARRIYRAGETGTWQGRSYGPGDELMVDEEQDARPLGAFQVPDARDAAIHLRRAGLHDHADAVEDLMLQHEGAKSQLDRDRRVRDGDNRYLQRLEARARIVDSLRIAGSDLVLYSRRLRRVLEAEDIDRLVRGDKPEEREGARTLLGGDDSDIVA